MKIVIVGAGYVGLVTGACFAEMGNSVVCVDSDADKIAMLMAGCMPIYEVGLPELVARNIANGTLRFATRLEAAMEQAEICIIAVGTPMSETGSANLQYVMEVAGEIGRTMQRPLLVVEKSTVPVGTAAEVRRIIQQELDRRGSALYFDVVSNPEFLKEGAAIEDCLKPDRIIVGAEQEASILLMRELYAPFIRNHERFIVMDVKSAEMTKYAANAMLATKISFMNEMANICEQVGADINKVRLGIGSDSRIGYSFIFPGCGYGGSCFPKDLQALLHLAQSVGYPAQLLLAVEDINRRQKQLLAKKVKIRFGDDLSGLSFAVWGLSFKPETDDMRDAPSLEVINALTEAGALVVVYDPQAMKQAISVYLKGNSSVRYAKDKYQALDGVDALLLITEWKEFRSPSFEEMASRMKNKVIFDGRNQYNSASLQKNGFEYFQIGVC